MQKLVKKYTSACKTNYRAYSIKLRRLCLRKHSNFKKFKIAINYSYTKRCKTANLDWSQLLKITFESRGKNARI